MKRSMKLVSAWPAANVSFSMMAYWKSRFVFTPTTTISSSAVRIFAIASVRSRPCTITLAIMES